MKKINNEIIIHEEEEVGNTWACIAVCGSMCLATYGAALQVAVAYYLF